MRNNSLNKSNDGNDYEVDYIHIEIQQPNLIILPIPLKNSHDNRAVELGIRFNNNTENRLHFCKYGTLIPEIVALNGEECEGKHYETREILSYSLSVMPRSSIVFSQHARLSLYKKKLRLEFFNKSNRLACYFNDLQSGTYQLRFKYHGKFDEQTEMVLLATQFVKLCFVELAKSNPHAVEVDGIRFETLVSRQKLTILPEQSNSSTSIQFGIRVINLSPNPYRFFFFGLMPELQDLDGNIIWRYYAINVTKLPQESDFLLVDSGESLTFFVDGEFSWNHHKLQLAGYESYGGCWIFSDLKPGEYRVCFTYESPSERRSIAFKKYSQTVTDSLWSGMVSTPFVKFSLVYS